jgi:sec-independent protein translocase protein TatC
MWLLFELGILLSKALMRRRAKEAEENPDPDELDSGGLGAAVSGGPGGRGGPSGAASPSQTPRGTTMSASSGSEIGRDLDPHFDDPGRWQPLSESEMEAELDLIEAEEVSDAPRDQAQGAGATSPKAAAAINSVEEKIRRANRLRELGSTFAARTVLYEVLEEGDADQRRVARNILNQLDEA